MNYLNGAVAKKHHDGESQEEEKHEPRLLRRHSFISNDENDMNESDFFTSSIKPVAENLFSKWSPFVPTAPSFFEIVATSHEQEWQSDPTRLSMAAGRSYTNHPHDSSTAPATGLLPSLSFSAQTNQTSCHQNQQHYHHDDMEGNNERRGQNNSIIGTQPKKLPSNRTDTATFTSTQSPQSQDSSSSREGNIIAGSPKRNFDSGDAPFSTATGTAGQGYNDALYRARNKEEEQRLFEQRYIMAGYRMSYYKATSGYSWTRRDAKLN